MTPAKTRLILFEIFMILLALAFIFPTIYVFINAFKGTQEIVLNPVGLPEHWTLDNFRNVLTREGAGGFTFFSSLWNTVVLTLFSVLGVVLLSSLAAYGLVRNKNRSSGTVFSVFTFFLVIPFQVIMVPLVVLATDLGSQGTLGLVIMYWGLGVPGAIFMYHGFIKSVPLSLEESASIDGAGQWTIFFRIVFPLLTPITATVGILNILWVWNDFLLPYIILRQGTLVLFQFNFFGQFTNDFGALTASLVLSSTPVLILYFALQKYIVRGIAAGAVKG